MAVVARLWQSVRDLPRLLQLLLVVAVGALVWTVVSVVGDDAPATVDGTGITTTSAATGGQASPTTVGAGQASPTTVGAGQASPTTVGAGQTSPTTSPAGDEATTTVVAGNDTGEEVQIGPTGDPVHMEPTEACPSGTYAEILGLLVCADS